VDSLKTIEQLKQDAQGTALQYVDEVFNKVVCRNAYESEFHQAVKEIFDSLIPDFAKHPKNTSSTIFLKES
jgi:glutamate dehydrogenase (NADP+)